MSVVHVPRGRRPGRCSHHASRLVASSIILSRITPVLFGLAWWTSRYDGRVEDPLTHVVNYTVAP